MTLVSCGFNVNLFVHAILLNYLAGFYKNVLFKHRINHADQVVSETAYRITDYTLI